MIPRVSYRHNLFIVSEVYIGSIGPKSLRLQAAPHAGETDGDAA